MTTKLLDFTDVAPPQITEKQWVHHPKRKDKILGSLAECNRGTLCFVAQRTRHPDADPQDFYRNVGGYSLVTQTAEALRRRGVGRIFIEETDNSRFVEYETPVFLSEGESLDDWKGEPQVCCPVDAAIHTWSVDEVAIQRLQE